MQQNQEVAHFLRHFMRDDGERGDDAQLRVGEKRRCDQYAIDEIVKRVADEYHHAAAAVIVMMRNSDDGDGRGRRNVRVVWIVRFAFLNMAVPPQHQFFENEEQQQAA